MFPCPSGQALDAAQALGIRRMVFHGGFIPHVYFPEWYVEQSVLFWRDFLQEVPPDFVLALENVMEPSPDTLVSIAAGGHRISSIYPCCASQRREGSAS